MIYSEGKQGRPRKSKDPDKESDNKKNYKSIYNPEEDREKRIYAGMQIRAKRRKILELTEKEKAEAVAKKLKFQKAILSQYQFKEWAPLGFLAHVPEYPEAGKILVLSRSTQGSDLENKYFPERVQAKEAKKAQEKENVIKIIDSILNK